MVKFKRAPTPEVFAWAFSFSRLGVWVYDLRDQKWHLSAEAVSCFKLAQQQAPTREMLLTRLSSIDRLRVDTAWSRLLDDAIGYDLEYLIESDSEECWIWERAEVVRGADGEAILIRGLVEDISERRASEKQMRFRANYDALTALPNRHMLDEHLKKSVALAGRRNERMVILAIDLDRFKQVNDTHGHAVGDEVLQVAARRMQGCLRVSDMLARQGGDEFIAVLQCIEFDATAGLIALRLIEEVSRPYQIGGLEISIGASVGIALLPEDGSDINEVLHRADSALYGAKHNGRETLYFFQREHDSAR